MKKHFVILAIVLLSSGCATTLQPTALDPQTGYFPTSSKLPADGIKVKKEFVSGKYRSLLYVKMEEKNEKYNQFFLKGFTNMNVFQKVADKNQLETLVFERKLTEKVSSVSDLIGLNNLQKQIGPFLVVEPYVEWKGGYNFEASLKAIDPETGETVLHIRNAALNWAGLDQPLFFPLLNGFLEWTQGKQITLAPKTDTN